MRFRRLLVVSPFSNGTAAAGPGSLASTPHVTMGGAAVRVTPAARAGRRVLPAVKLGSSEAVNVQKAWWIGFESAWGGRSDSSRHHHQVEYGCGRPRFRDLIEILPLAIQG